MAGEGRPSTTCQWRRASRGKLPYILRMNAPAPAPTNARREVRLPADVHALLKRAAELQGRTLTDFVVTAAREAAQRAIEDSENLRLSLEDQRRVAEAMLNAPEPTPALRRAFERRRALLGAE